MSFDDLRKLIPTMSEADIARIEQTERERRETVAAEFSRTKALLLSKSDSDEATEAADHLWQMLEDPSRWKFLRWCFNWRLDIGARPFGRVLANC